MCNPDRVRAIDLAEQIPIVRRETSGAEAARVIAEYRFPGLVVGDDDGVPIAVVPSDQILALILPQYVVDDPRLAHAFDEAGADDLCAKLNDAVLGDLLKKKRLTAPKPPSVLPQDTLIEVVTTMVTSHSPLIIVVDRAGTYHGTVLLSRVLAAIATRAGQDSHLVRRRLELDVVAPPTGEAHPQ